MTKTISMIKKLENLFICITLVGDFDSSVFQFLVYMQISIQKIGEVKEISEKYSYIFFSFFPTRIRPRSFICKGNRERDSGCGKRRKTRMYCGQARFIQGEYCYCELFYNTNNETAVLTYKIQFYTKLVQM